MLKLLRRLTDDDHGFILSAELVIVGTVLVLGLVSGLACLQQSVNCELKDVAGAVDHLNQSYSFSGILSQCKLRCRPTYTAGSSFLNCEQHCEISCAQMVGTSCLNQCGASGNAGACNACGLTNCSGGCDTTAYRINTGVRKMKVTETPSGLHPVPSECDPCDGKTESGSISIPDSVW